jgi:hypothetical protein
MKHIFKYIKFFFLFIIVAGGIYYFANNESLPEGKKGKEADALANKMLKAIDNDTYKNTQILEWSFRGKHFYKWQKQENIVTISWDKNKVILHTNEPQKSTIFVEDIKVENTEILKKAITFFNNDSFWLIAPYKTFDAGTERRIVNYNGKEALLVTFTSGGTTPGDSYLWILDKDFIPTSFKMWAKIIPIGGVYATWSDLKKTASGIKLPTKHQLSLFGMELNMGEIKAYNK